MKQIFFFFFTIAFYPFFCIAQNTDLESFSPFIVETGEEYKSKTFRDITYTSTNEDGSFYGIIKGRKINNGTYDHTFYISKFNQELKREEEFELILPNKKAFVKNVLVSNGRLCAIVSEFSKDSKSKKTYLQKIRTDSIRLEPKRVLISSVEDDSKIDLESEEFLFSRLKDESKTVMLSRGFEKVEGQEKYRLSLLDSNLNLERNFEVNLRVAEECALGDIHLLNENTCLISILPKSTRLKKAVEKKIPLTLAKVDLIQKTVEYFEYDINGSYILDFKFSEVMAEAITCAGFYNKSTYKSPVGGFLLTIDFNTLEKKSLEILPFDDDFIFEDLRSSEVNDLRKRNEKGQPSGIDYLSCDGFIPSMNGGYFLLGEVKFWGDVAAYPPTTSNGMFAAGSPHPYQFLNEIVILKVSEDFKIEWKSKIRKVFANSRSNYWGSYLMLESREGVTLLFNDNKKNFNRTEGGKIESFDILKSRIVQVSYNEAGEEVEKKNLSETSIFDGLAICPLQSDQRNKDSAILHFTDSRKRKFMRIIMQKGEQFRLFRNQEKIYIL